MSNINYSPGIQNSPFGLLNANPEGSFYSGDSAFSPLETDLIQKAIRYQIFDAAPAQYNALKVLFSKPYKEYGATEFEYKEKTFGRSPIEANAITAAQAAVPGNFVTQTITLTAASVQYVTVDLIIVYPDGTKGVVTSIVGNDITVNSITNFGLPAVAVGDEFPVMSTIRGDGMNTFSNYERLEVITRYNYIQHFLRARRWDRLEHQTYVNQGTTSYMNDDKEEKMKQLRVDLFNTMWNGERGEYEIANGYVARAMGGIFPTMVNAGAANVTTTTAGFKASFENTAFATAFKQEGGTRFIYGTDQQLNLFSEIYKQPGLIYEGNDEVAKLRLKKVELGSQNFVLVPTELWREESCFEASWANRLIILDQETVSPVKMKGIPALEMGQTDNMNKGTREDYIDWWCRAQLSLEFNNPVSSFSMNVI